MEKVNIEVTDSLLRLVTKSHQSKMDANSSDPESLHGQIVQQITKIDPAKIVQVAIKLLQETDWGDLENSATDPPKLNQTKLNRRILMAARDGLMIASNVDNESIKPLRDLCTLLGQIVEETPDTEQNKVHKLVKKLSKKNNNGISLAKPIGKKKMKKIATARLHTDDLTPLDRAESFSTENPDEFHRERRRFRSVAHLLALAAIADQCDEKLAIDDALALSKIYGGFKDMTAKK